MHDIHIIVWEYVNGQHTYNTRASRNLQPGRIYTPNSNNWTFSSMRIEHV